MATLKVGVREFRERISMFLQQRRQIFLGVLECDVWRKELDSPERNTRPRDSERAAQGQHGLGYLRREESFRRTAPLSPRPFELGHEIFFVNIRQTLGKTI